MQRGGVHAVWLNNTARPTEMNPSESAKALLKFASVHRCDLNEGRPAAGLDAMVTFFREGHGLRRVSDDP